jgi:adenosylhomocysteine nucleosidase
VSAVSVSVQPAIVVGMTAEDRIARRLGWPVAIGGGTADGARSAANALVQQGCTALISFGLAGGLDPLLRPGALVVPTTVIAGDLRYAADVDLSRMLGGPTPHVILAADTIVASVADKNRLWEQTGAAAVDLESGAVARVAAEYGIPFAVLRAICDPAERALPPAALAALDTRGAIAIWRVLAAIIARPTQLPALFTLAADAATARRSLIARVRQTMPAPLQQRSAPELPR